MSLITPILTADGSLTARHPILGCLYHSDRGAKGEAIHVYIQNGLLYYIENMLPSRIEILDMGFGTGLNAVLTAENTTVPTIYRTIEKYPLSQSDQYLFHYDDISPLSKRILQAPWDAETVLTSTFSIQKSVGDILKADLGHPDIVYWDAFDPISQPELWTVNVFQRLFHAMKPHSVLVTYSAKGTVKQALRDAGFSLERIPGAMGKHHMLRATHP